MLAGHTEVPPPDVAEGPPDHEVYAYAARSREELLPGRRSKARRGDFVVGNRLVRFVVGGLRNEPGFPNFTGYLLDAGRVGKPGDLLGAATLMLELRSVRVTARYRTVEVASDGRDGTAVVRATGDTWRWPWLKVVTQYRLGSWDEHLTIETTLESSGSRRLVSLGLGDYLRWTNAATFFPGKGFRLRKKRHASGWIARRGVGTSFAWFVRAGKIASAVLTSHQGSRYNTAMRIFVKRVNLAPGKKVSYTRFLAVGQGEIADAARIAYAVRGEKAQAVTGQVIGQRSKRPLPGVRVRAYSPRGRKLVSEAATDAKGAFELHLPEGKYRLVAWEWGRADSAPAAVRVGDKPVSGVVLAMRPPGRVYFEVRDEKSGDLLPARAIFRGLGRTREPKFVPAREDRQFDNVLYTHNGRLLRNVPQGRYRVLVTRGPEYTVDEREVQVKSGQVASFFVKIARVVDTRGYIACDFHLHSVNSQDSLVGLRERVTSLVSENVELAVPTDHNHVTDYRPIIGALGVAKFIAAVPGDEVTTQGFRLGHFNVFPVMPEAGTPGEGAFAFERRLPREIFAEVRARPGPERVIQVNHPRLGRGNGYWNNVGWDGSRGATDDPNYSPAYDAIEVFNGLDKTLDRTDRVMREWWVLLNRGFRYTATGNSDSHRLGYEEVGYPRNFVAVSDDRPQAVDAEELVASVKAGRVMVTNGPFVRVRALAAGKALAAGAGPAPEPATGDPRVPRPPGGPSEPQGGMGALVRAGTEGVTLEIDVQAAPWVDVAGVEIVGNGEVVKEIAVRRTSKVERYRGAVTLKPKVDTWYLVMVRGKSALPTLVRRRISPFGFTNPIWVDANGDGVFASVGTSSAPGR
jgi:hypothetical protein